MNYNYFKMVIRIFGAALTLALFLSQSAAIAATTEKPVVRAAFDLGSADFKLCVGEVSEGKLKIIFKKVIRVDLGPDCIENKGTLSERMQIKALEALSELRADAERHGATSFSGIATAVFRIANNGDELLESLKEHCKMPLKIVPQAEEGRLGFLTGVAIFPQTPPEKLLLLDLGSSSVQITGNTKEQFYGAKLGYNNANQLFAEQIRHQAFIKGTLYNNITFEEICELSNLLVQRIPEPDSNWIYNRITYDNAQLSLYDYTVFIDTIKQLTSKDDHLMLEDIEIALKNLTCPDFPLKNVTAERRQYRLFIITLLYSIMKKMGIEEINLGINDVGSTPGLALAEEYW